MPRTWPTVTRWDYGFVRILLLVTTLALLVSAATRLWPSSPVHLAGTLRADGPAYTPADLSPGVSARYTPEIVWTVADPTVGQRLAAAAPSLWLLLCGLGIVWAVWKLLGATASGEPFTRDSVRYSRWLAGMFLTCAILYPFVQMTAHFALVTQFQHTPEVLMHFKGSDFLPVVAGLLLVVLTEVYARGLELRDDVDGLV